MNTLQQIITENERKQLLKMVEDEVAGKHWEISGGGRSHYKPKGLLTNLEVK